MPRFEITRSAFLTITLEAKTKEAARALANEYFEATTLEDTLTLTFDKIITPVELGLDDGESDVYEISD